MNNNRKHKVVTVVFCLFLAVLSVLAIAHEPRKISTSERMPLQQFPDITVDSVLDKSAIDKFETYTIHQFPFRDFFRSLKARFHYGVLNITENNGYAFEGEYIAEIKNNFTDDLVNATLTALKKMYNTYLAGNAENVYFSIVPDKNYFFGQQYGYPAPLYEELVKKAIAELSEAEYIDLFSALELEDYYKTDTHWSQDKLDKVIEALGSKMGFSDRLSGQYTSNSLYPFYGVYHGKSAMNPKPDTLVYLTNEILKDCTVYNYETEKTSPLYDEAIFNEKVAKGEDGYDFFLQGATAMLRIDNPHATTDKELVIFRDSFGSSLSPLLAEGYKSIYVVDLRYVQPKYVFNKIQNKVNPVTKPEENTEKYYIDFEGKDVLFIYSALIIDTASTMGSTMNPTPVIDVVLETNANR